MPKTNPRVADYIQESKPFARPILRHLRKVVHQTCPKAAEDIKWGMPAFIYNDKILCGLAAFKAHCALWFWEGKDVVGKKGPKEGMGNFGRIASLKDLPSTSVIKKYVKKAMIMNEAKTKPKKKKTK